LAIANAWNVKMWPTVYLIDHASIIQQRVFFDESQLDALVASAEQPESKAIAKPVAP